MIEKAEEAVETIQSESLSIQHFEFCMISTLNEHCAEIVFKNGVDVTSRMLDEIQDWINNNIKSPVRIIINKIFSYSYTFDAQLQLPSLSNNVATAVVCYNDMSEKTTMILHTTTNHQSWNMKIFYDRGEALNWINEQ